MEGLLSGYFDVKIFTINWRSNRIAIEVTTDKYMEKDAIGNYLWKEKSQ
ncbi:hypothetical protein [Prevotella amnii]|nr:hypothetical protein [Prevotella amnii]